MGKQTDCVGLLSNGKQTGCVGLSSMGMQTDCVGHLWESRLTV